MQAPYTPTATVACLTQWEVNDPLVHYLASDLAGSDLTNPPVPQMTPLTFGVLNDRYQPWGGKPQFSPTAGDASFEFQNRFNRAIKDPLVSSSDYWIFPANKFPTTGWLGRVHRGTPWQTVYLKSADVLATGGIIPWMSWTGNPNPFDAVNDAPVQDRLLFDVFTTAFNDNATRGTLSVNQAAGSADPDAGLAAWSAVFSGLVVAGPTNSYTVITPAGTNVPNSALGILVSNINYTRANFQSADGLAGVFEHEGDILSVPQLSDLTPFLNPAQTNYNSDAMYEWLPQQIMSLLRVGAPRYVIYSYGQALKPAKNGVNLGAGAQFGTVTNYQVTAEIATRAVVRIETVRTNAADGTVIVSPPRAVIENFNVLPPN